MLFKKIHLNCTIAAPIIEIITKPNSLTTPFSMFKDIDNYVDWYKKKFSQTYLWNVKKSQKIPLQFPFVKKLGQFVPISAYEVRNLPLLRSSGKGISLVSKNNRWMLPLRMFPNWKINIERQELETNSENWDISCHPLINLYPFGMVFYQIRFSLKFPTGLDIMEFIKIISIIKEKKILSREKEKYDVLGIIKEFHRYLLNDIIKEKPDKSDFNYSNMHRIMTINSFEGKIDPVTNQKELFGIIEVDTIWDKFRQNYIENKVKNYIEGKFQNQFFLFNSSSTIFYPSDPAEKSQYNGYIRRRIRRHYSSLIEFCTIQSQFVKMMRRELQTLYEQADSSNEKRDQLEYLIGRLNDIGWIKSNYYWNLVGKQKEFFEKVGTSIGLDRNLDEILRKVNQVKEFLNPQKNMTAITITGEGNVVNTGNNNTITILNQKFKGTDKEELGKAIALLRGEIMQLNLTDKVKNRLRRNTENLEDETLDTKPDSETIANELNSVKDDLEKNGITYDKNTGWGQRLKEIAEGIVKFVPTILPLVTTLLK